MPPAFGWRWLILGIVCSLCSLRALVAADSASESRLRRDVTFLASDECEGRGVATKGINLAADYIAQEFLRAGLKPLGPGGDYFQPFTVAAGAARLETTPTLTLHGEHGALTLKPDEEFRALGLSGTGHVQAPVAFAGYGVVAPEASYDDFRNLDAAGKILLILRRTPRYSANPHAQPPFAGAMQEHHAALVTKLVNAELHKAAAVLLVSDSEQAREDNDALLDFAATAQNATHARLPAFHIRRAVADQMLQASLHKSLADIEREIAGDLKPRSMPLSGWSAALDLRVERKTAAVKNIVGALEGSGPLAGETVVIGAHYDHLGYGGPSSLARDRKPAIHHGADDNASGSSVLMELARRFGADHGRQGRRLVFIAFSGEESGLLGSEYYCKHPLLPLASTVAMLNMDMVGRLRADKTTNKWKLVVYGTGTSPSFGNLVDQANQRFGMQVQKVAGATLASERSSSDHASFYAQKIPVLFLFTGNHPDYHRPSDTADKINVAGMGEVADFAQELVSRLAQNPARPAYVRVSSGSPGPVSSAGGRMPRMGVRPSYGDEGEGVLLDGVSDNGPAAKAGLREGDRIVELAGQPVKDLNAYMVIMAVQKRGKPLPVGIIRDGKRQIVQVTPE